jgi:hypothetical protein
MDGSDTFANVQQLPDVAGGQLFDTLVPFSPATCVDAIQCSFLVVANDSSLVPGNVGGAVPYGYPQNGTLVSYEVDYNATPQRPYWPSYVLSFYTQTNFYCPPSVCPTITDVTGDIQLVVTIPWLNATGNVVRFDTVEFVGPAVYTPEPSTLVPILLVIGIVLLGGRLARQPAP